MIMRQNYLRFVGYGPALDSMSQHVEAGSSKARMSPLNTAGRHKRKAPCPSRRSGLRFEASAVAGHGKAESEINQSHEQVDLDTERLPRGIDDGGLRCRQQVEDADDQDQTGILEERDERIHEWRDHMTDSLRQNDQTVFLPVREAERVGCLMLSPRNSLQAAAYDFRKIGAGVKHERDLGSQQLVDVDAIRHEQWKHDAGHEQQADQRNATDELDIKHAKRTDRGELGAAAERDDNPE